MRLRPPRWLRRTSAPQGRHMRGVAPVTVPGAAATLVSAAAEPYLVIDAPSAVERLAEPLAAVPVAAGSAPDDVTDGDPTLELHAVGHEPPVTEGEIDGAPVPGPALGSGPLVDPPEPEPLVGLGFADGDVLELAADDPRAAGFRDVAAAVLGRTAP